MNQIQKAGEYIYRAPSDSGDRVYVVDITPDSPATCTCVAFAIKRNKTGTGKCKHLDRVLEFVTKETRDEIARIKAKEEEKATVSELMNIFMDLQ